MFLADILNVVAMCWYLYRKRTGLTRSDTTIKTLMTYCISTGLLSSIIALMSFIFFYTAPTTLLSDALFGTVDKCHVNSLLAMLNSRESMLGREETPDASTFYMSSITTSQQKGTNQESMPRVGQPSAQESVDVRQSTSRDVPPCKRDDNTEPSLPNVEILDAAISGSSCLDSQRSLIESV
ncbi:hypothetical protein BGW80DRAFT_1271421 [Lactifluus volemus]|nr:hypothetical protein BGW80DRAFT_1271421 [Lactifluus volemus]